MIEDFDRVVEQVKAFLPQYLERHGYDVSKKFRCINPKHQDTEPSCHLVPMSNGTIGHCFGCHENFTIFKAAHFLEGKPLTGPGFITDNLLYLAGLFNVEVKFMPLTEEQQFKLHTYQAYADAAQVITSFPPSQEIERECQYRRWPVEVMHSLQIGWVPSFQAYLEAMLARGWDLNFLNDIDLGWRHGKPNPIFSPNSLIFTICDEHGRPCGFASRNLNYDPNRDKDRKFCNTTTSTKCDIYQKSKRLYGLHLSKQHQPPLYIVEGYADWVSLYLNGIKNVVALGGTAFTEQHLETLLQLDIRDLIIALDGDAAGAQRTEQLIERYLTGRKDLTLKVLTLPEGYDPDDFLREHGVEAWQQLKVETAFSWRLARFSHQTPPQDVAEVMLPYLVNEPSAIRRELMLRELMAVTGFSYKSLEQELERLLNAKEAARLGRKEEIILQAAAAARRSPDEAVLLLQNAIRRIQEVDKAYNRDRLSVEEFYDFLTLQYEREQTKPSQPEGFRLGPDLQEAEPYLEGGDIYTALAILGGVNNAGKTNLLSKLAISIAQYNPDATVIVHTIDDNREKFITRLAMQALGEEAGEIELNWLKNPNFYSRLDQNLHTKHRIAYDRLRALAADRRLIVKDVQLGANLAVIESMLSYYRHHLSDRRLVFFLDNFSLLDMLQGDKDHERIRQTMKEFKRLLTKYQVFAIATMEYTKLEPWERPTYNKLKGSAGAGFDPDIIMHLYNDMRAHGQQSRYYHVGPNGEHLPTVEWIFDKNKVNGHAGTSVWLDMWPTKAQFKYVSPAEIERRLTLQGDVKDHRPKLLFTKYQTQTSLS